MKKTVITVAMLTLLVACVGKDNGKTPREHWTKSKDYDTGHRQFQMDATAG